MDTIFCEESMDVQKVSMDTFWVSIDTQKVSDRFHIVYICMLCYLHKKGRKVWQEYFAAYCSLVFDKHVYRRWISYVQSVCITKWLHFKNVEFGFDLWKRVCCIQHDISVGTMCTSLSTSPIELGMLFFIHQCHHSNSCL